MKECRQSTEGEAFLRQWYCEIDGKKPFSEISGKTVGKDLIVDFPGNPLDFSGFRDWYESQCLNYTGKHDIHTVEVTEDKEHMEIFSEITWKAEDKEGKTVTLYPNVTLKLRQENGWKVYYYGCRDRQ